MYKVSGLRRSRSIVKLKYMLYIQHQTSPSWAWRSWRRWTWSPGSRCSRRRTRRRWRRKTWDERPKGRAPPYWRRWPSTNTTHHNTRPHTTHGQFAVPRALILARHSILGLETIGWKRAACRETTRKSVHTQGQRHEYINTMQIYRSPTPVRAPAADTRDVKIMRTENQRNTNSLTARSALRLFPL